MTTRTTTKITVGTGKKSITSIPVAGGDSSSIPNLIASHISRDTGIDQQSLSDWIVEVTPETQTSGPALLQVQVVDPQWTIQRGLALDADGFLPLVDVNYPEGTPVWWRLVMVDGGSDITQANLTLTFRHRVVEYLAVCAGPLTWPAGKSGSTRAQFLKMLADKMPLEVPKNAVGAIGKHGSGGPSDFAFVCPDLNVVQPIVVSGSSKQTVLTSTDANAAASAINKTPGVTNATAITIKGQTPTPAQITNINLVMTAATALKAPRLAAVALIEACIQESTMQNLPGGDSTSKGILQFLSDVRGHRTIDGETLDVTNVEACAVTFLTKNYYTQAGWNYGKPRGGAIASANANPTATAAQIAQAAQGSKYPSAYEQWKSEAETIVDAHGGLVGSTGSSTTTPESDVSQLARGSADDPDEDSWTCMQRLASEVNWRCYTNPQPHPGFWGNYIYFVDDTTLIKSTPSLYIKLDDSGEFWSVANHGGKFLGGDGDSMIDALTYTMDDTSIQAQQLNTAQVSVSGTGKKSKVARKTAIRKPQTPTHIQCNLITGAKGVMEFNAGSIVVVQNTGIIDGRWILENNTRNTLGDLFDQLTIGPTEFAYPEPQATQPTNAAVPAPANTPGAGLLITAGALQGAADAANKALALQSANAGAYHYSERFPIPSSLFSSGAVSLDCAQFVALCYKSAGLPDPAKSKYTASNTSMLIAHCKPISDVQAVPGDLCFFGSSESATVHVNIYVGGGQSVNMGSEGEPKSGPSASMGPSNVKFLGFYRSNVAPTATAQPSGTGSHSKDASSGTDSSFSSIFNPAHLG